jgi:hypothetical protein
MATDSVREQIIAYNETLLNGMKVIQSVVRKMPDMASLKNFAVTQFPLVAVVGRLPVPQEKIKGRKPGGVDMIKFSLKVDLFVYIQNAVEPDTEISNLADEIWRTFYVDQTKGELVTEVKLQIVEGTEYWDPFAAFQITDNSIYFRDIGGI